MTLDFVMLCKMMAPVVVPVLIQTVGQMSETRSWLTKIMVSWHHWGWLNERSLTDLFRDNFFHHFSQWVLGQPNFMWWLSNFNIWGLGPGLSHCHNSWGQLAYYNHFTKLHTFFADGDLESEVVIPVPIPPKVPVIWSNCVANECVQHKGPSVWSSVNPICNDSFVFCRRFGGHRQGMMM